MSNKNILLKDYITVIEPSDELLSLVDAMSEMDLPRLGDSSFHCGRNSSGPQHGQHHDKGNDAGGGCGNV
jgi:hypothetical protein